jgi:uncharacterized membrane protein YdjX (TVP38/TMEM64 family)
MKGLWVKIAVMLLVVGAAILAKLLLQDDLLSIHHVKEHREQLLLFIRNHHVEAILSFIGLYIGTAFFLPGALALTVAGGMMFGTIQTVIYANLAATTGAALAFITARFVIGGWLQGRFPERLDRFNAEISQHGQHYLLVLRILPVAPFFVVNYCAGITKIPLKTFVWTTSIGMIPGSLIYAFIGEQLRGVNASADLFSWKILLALVLLALFALLPVLLHHLPGWKK